MKMEVAMKQVDSVPLAGFWQHAFALIIDAFVVFAATALVALLLFRPTNGAVRISELPLVKSSACASVNVDRNAFPLPADFTISRAEVCVRSTFGLVHDRWLEITDRRRSGSVTSSRSVTLPVDDAGRVTRATPQSLAVCERSPFEQMSLTSERKRRAVDGSRNRQHSIQMVDLVL